LSFAYIHGDVDDGESPTATGHPYAGETGLVLGPILRTEPCGTPNETVDSVELVFFEEHLLKCCS